MIEYLANIERLLRKFFPAVILFNVVVALLWIPAFIYGLFKPEKALSVSEVQKPSPPEPLPKPVEVPPLQVERKEERKEERVEREEKKLRREEEPQANVRREEKREEKKEEKKEKSEVVVKVEEEKPPKGPFGFACKGNNNDCYLFDVASGKRYRKGDTVDGWLIKDIDIHGATLVKDRKEVRVGVE